jgi:PKD repeat protein
MRRLAWSGLLLFIGCGDDGGAAAGTDTDDASTGAVSTGTNEDTATTTTESSDDESSADSTGEPPPNEPPVAVIEASVHSGGAPLVVELDASASSDPDGTIVSWEWTFDDGTTASGEQVSHTFEDGGCHSIELVVTDDGGATASASDMVAVVLGTPMSPVQATVDSAPLASAVLPRDVDDNEGTAHFAGTLTSTGWGEIVAELVAEDVVVGTAFQLVCSDPPFAFEVDLPVPAERTAFEVRLSAGLGEQREAIVSVPDVVAGDVYIVQGQSNAVSGQYNGDANVDQGPFIRTFDGAQWVTANGNAGGEGSGAGIGQWPMRMSGALSEAHDMPIAIINAANGGQPIGFFQRNDDNPLDTNTNYGRLLTRIQAARLQEGIRAILWYQGESDGGDFQGHRDGFLALVDDWRSDYTPIERIYVTQLRAGCGGDVIGTQEVQRTLPDEFDDMTVMSTNALDGHDGCHYAYAEGYEELGNRYAGLLGRDLYEEAPAQDVEPPNPESAQFAGGGTQIVLTLRNAQSDVTWQDGAQIDFRLEGSAVTVISGAAEGNVVTLTLSGDGSAATGLTYLGRIGAGQWVTNENGIGLLSFFALPIEAE